MKRIVLTGGGSAGHVTPHMALIPQLSKDGWEIHYVGTADGIERELMAAYKEVTYHAISSGKLRRYLDIKNLRDPFRVIKGVGQSARLMHKLRPQVLFSKGGFVSVPAVIGASLCGVPTVLHESDLTPGLANKLCAPFSKKILTSFEQTAKSIGAKAVYTGSPMRESLFNGDAKAGLAFTGLPGRKPVLLMMGGSLGAQAINDCLREKLPELLKHFEIIHLCGAGGLDPKLKNTPGYFQCEYVSDELPDLFALCSLVLSRAGSNAIFELLALGKPNLLIPLPLAASRGDQLLNAQNFEKAGYSKVLPQEEMTGETLVAALLDLWENRGQYVTAMGREPRRSGAQRVLQEIYASAKK